MLTGLSVSPGEENHAVVHVGKFVLQPVEKAV